MREHRCRRAAASAGAIGSTGRHPDRRVGQGWPRCAAASPYVSRTGVVGERACVCHSTSSRRRRRRQLEHQHQQAGYVAARSWFCFFAFFLLPEAIRRGRRSRSPRPPRTIPSSVARRHRYFSLPPPSLLVPLVPFRVLTSGSPSCDPFGILVAPPFFYSRSLVLRSSVAPHSTGPERLIRPSPEDATSPRLSAAPSYIPSPPRYSEGGSF